MKKHRWDMATGRVVGVRLPDSVYAKVKARAEGRGMTVSEYCRTVLEREVSRSHHKKPK
ncbi:hypothetical protein ES705_29371 [subsurface metagenome]